MLLTIHFTFDHDETQETYNDVMLLTWFECHFLMVSLIMIKIAYFKETFLINLESISFYSINVII